MNTDLPYTVMLVLPPNALAVPGDMDHIENFHLARAVWLILLIDNGLADFVLQHDQHIFRRMEPFTGGGQTKVLMDVSHVLGRRIKDIGELANLGTIKIQIGVSLNARRQGE